ncbi:MAG: hypothetical protein P4L51_04640 [Puia sp.]|nr:hypothetical protein [Puia sp.]
MILKESAKPRKKKQQLEVEKKEKQEMDRHIGMLMDTEAAVKSKRYKFEEVPTVLKQHEDLIQYLREKGVMDEMGQMKV